MMNTNYESLATTVIEAPQSDFEARKHNLFLAGGISNCPNWQLELINGLQDRPNLNIFNPRRQEYDIANTQLANEQISWEFQYLKDATEIAVWFSRGSINPIVLYELGMWVNSRPDIPAFIGVDPEYERKIDVSVQTKLARPELEIVNSIGSLLTQISTHLDKLG